MRRYAKTSVDVPLVEGKPVVLEIKSSNGKKTYKLDITLGRCSCPGWVFHAKNGSRKPCKHLKMYGFVEIPGQEEVTE